MTFFILLVAGAVYAVFRFSFFRLTTVEVSGSPRTEEIKNAFIAELNKNSSFRFLGPENLFFWSANAVKEKPVDLLWISEFILKRNWREKKVFIEVKEWRPNLLGCVGLSPLCYWLSEKGMVLAAAPLAEGFIIPKLYIENKQTLSPGDLFLSSVDSPENVLEIVRQFRDFSFAPVRFLIKNPEFRELEVETDGPKLYFNLRFEPQNIIWALDDLADRLNFKKLEYLDFRTENRVFYR